MSDIITQFKVLKLYTMAEYFALNKSVTDLALKNIGKSLGNWQLTAKRHQLRSDEIKRMAPSFEHEDSQRLISIATKTISRSRSS
jgi:serine/threonine-protein kinase HipA